MRRLTTLLFAAALTVFLGAGAGLLVGCEGTTTTSAGVTSTSSAAPATSVGVGVPSTDASATTGSGTGSAMFRANLERTGVYPSGGPTQLHGLVWKFKVDGGTGSTLKRDAVSSSPAVADGVVYVGSPDGHLYAVDSKSGHEKWKFKTSGAIESSPAIADGVVYFGSGDHYLYAVDSRSGQEKWKFKTGAPVTSSPAVWGGVLYVGSHDHYLYAVDTQTGQEKWKFQTGFPVASSPAVADGVVYFGRWYRYLLALDATSGRMKWKFQTGESGLWGDRVSSPAVSDGVAYVVCSQGIYAVDIQTGQQKWPQPARGGADSPGSPAVSHGVVYVRQLRGWCLVLSTLAALDSRSGQALEEFKTPESIRSSPSSPSSPAISGGMVYYGGFGGTFGEPVFYLYAVDSKTGQERWKFPTGGQVASAPAVVNGVVYFSSLDGYLYAVK